MHLILSKEVHNLTNTYFKTYATYSSFHLLGIEVQKLMELRFFA